MVFAARTLGPSVSADFFAVIALVALCQVALGPINGTVARFSAAYAGEYGKVRTLCREVAKRVALFGLVGLAVAWLAMGSVAGVLKLGSSWPLTIACAMLYLTLILSVARGCLRGLQRFGQYNINIVFEALVRLVGGVAILSVVAADAAAALLGYLLALAAVLVLSWVQLRRIWGRYEPRPVDGGAVRRFTIPMFLMMFTAAGMQNIDMLFVKHFFDPMEAGVYGAAFKLAGAIGVLVTAFNTQLLPLITSLHERGRSVVVPLVRLCGYFSLLALLPLTLFWYWSAPVMLLLYDRAFEAGAPLLFGLTAARVLGYLALMIASAGAAMNRFRFLYVYVPALAIQVVGLAVWHTTPATVINVLIVTNALTLVALLVDCAMGIRSKRADAGKVSG